MAVEGFGDNDHDPTTLLNATMKIAQNCILNSDIDVNNLPTVDLEYLFLNIRKKSIGEVIELNIKHNAEGCGAKNKIEVNLDDTKLVTPENHSNCVCYQYKDQFRHGWKARRRTNDN